MNIKIKKGEHGELMAKKIHDCVIGSKLYGTDAENSDTDILCIFEPGRSWSASMAYPSQHQFQYDDVANNTQYIWTTILQFWRNLNSGDSTINADVVLFGKNPVSVTDSWRLKSVRNYKVVKAYIGFARRDLKNYKGKNKLFHAERSLYCAECIMNGQLPTIEVIQDIAKSPQDRLELIAWESDLRKRCNTMYEKDELKTYSIAVTGDKLLQKLLDSNNIKEFKY